MPRIAFFGGSFDPPHRGHLAIAKAAADRFALDKVLFAPVARQPLKENFSATPFSHRYAMTALAAQADARFVPSLLDGPPIDGDTTRPNYTVETLERLRKTLPADTALFTLLGADSWLDIARWRQPVRLLGLSDWIIAARPGFSLADAEAALPPETTTEPHDVSGDVLVSRPPDGTVAHVFFLTSVWQDVSATELRAALETGSMPTEFLPPTVADYIRKTGLYRSSTEVRDSRRSEESIG